MTSNNPGAKKRDGDEEHQGLASPEGTVCPRSNGEPVRAGRGKHCDYACAHPPRSRAGAAPPPGWSRAAVGWPSGTVYELAGGVHLFPRGRVPGGAERSVGAAPSLRRWGVRLRPEPAGAASLRGTWPAVGTSARSRRYLWGPLLRALRGCRRRGRVSGAG